MAYLDKTRTIHGAPHGTPHMNMRNVHDELNWHLEIRKCCIFIV